MNKAIFKVAKIIAFCSLLCFQAMAKDTQMVRGFKGKEVAIKNPVNRIVSIPMPGASIFISVDGKADRLVGIHEVAKQAILDGILGDFYPKAKKINSKITAGSGFIPNVETILSLNPDVVVQWEFMPKTFKPMENAGLKVASFVKYTKEDLMIDNLRLVAKILNKEQKQEELIKWRKDTQKKIEKKGSKIAPKDKKSVVIIYHTKKGLTVFGGEHYTGFFVDMAGGVQYPRKKTHTQIDMEQLLQWDPDILMIGNFGPLMPEDIYKDQKFSSLKAVKNKSVYRVPLGGYRWVPPNQESPLAWMWFYNIMHPNKDPFDLRAEIKDAYKFIYEKTPSEKQIDGILHMGLNGKSAHYDQFKR